MSSRSRRTGSPHRRAAEAELWVAVDGDAVHAELNGTPRASAVRALVTAGVEVRSAGPRRRLEDAFLQLVGEDQAG